MSKAAVRCADANRPRQPHEYLTDRAVVEAKPVLRHEKRLGFATRVHAVTHTAITQECLARGLVHGHQAFLSTLRAADGEHAFTEVDVSSIERERFTDPH